MDNFKIGSVVGLKSGGPLMTVREVTDTTVVLVYWSDKEGDFRDVHTTPEKIAMFRILD